MKQGKGKQSVLLPQFQGKELEVCDILLDLESLFVQSNQDNCAEVPFWGNKKRRSSKAASSSSPSLPPHHPIETNTKVDDKVEAPSPATPLSFSPGESDEKPKHSYKKKGKEELMGIIQELTQSRDILKGEVERVRNYYNQLQIHNTELKAWKQKILVKKEEKFKKISLKNNGVSFGQHFGISSYEQQQQQQYYAMNQYPHHQQYGQLFPSSSSAQSASSLRQPIGPRGIPDLNVSAEEAFGVDTFQPSDHHNMMITRENPKEKRLKRRIIRTNKRNEQRGK